MNDYRFIIQTNGQLKPTSRKTYEHIMGLGIGSEVKVKFQTERNPLHSNKYWALMECGYQHLCGYVQLEDAEQLSHILQYLNTRDGYKECGKIIKLQSGEMFERESLAFNSMSQEKFQRIYDLQINKLVTLFHKFGLGITREELEDNAGYYN